jgi:hypothetical protein
LLFLFFLKCARSASASFALPRDAPRSVLGRVAQQVEKEEKEEEDGICGTYANTDSLSARGTPAFSQFENHWQAVVAGLFADFIFQVSVIAFVEEIFVVHE